MYRFMPLSRTSFVFNRSAKLHEIAKYAAKQTLSWGIGNTHSLIHSGVPSEGIGGVQNPTQVDEDFFFEDDEQPTSIAAEIGVTRESPSIFEKGVARLGLSKKLFPDKQEISEESVGTWIGASENHFYQETKPSDTDEKVKTDKLLPYDDEEFADSLLEMQADGSLEETWDDPKNKMEFADLKELIEVLRSMKVRDIFCIDVSEKTSSFDAMVIGTCEGPRHIRLAAWGVQQADRKTRASRLPRKQFDHQWEVVPIGRVVVHLMVGSCRETFSLERKWAVTKNMDILKHANAPVSEGRQVKAHGLWTLTVNLQDLEDFEVDYCKDALLGQF